MCIAILSTAHPSYRLILLDNRDEFLNRPTAIASYWPSPDSTVLGGRDLLRPVQGTWLGITTTGKLAVLTNYREDTSPPPTAVSRGAIIRQFLTDDVPDVADWVRETVSTGTAKDAGGFSLVCGKVGEELAVVSNRAEDGDDVPWIMGLTGQTVGLSNAAFTDRSWPKVTLGEEMVREAIKANVEGEEGEEKLVENLLKVLNHDTLPRHGDLGEGGLDTYITDLRKTILVPPIGRKSMAGLDEGSMRAARNGEKVRIFDGQTNLKPEQLGVDGIYATQKQTVILIDHNNRVRFFERSLFDTNSDVIPTSKGDVDLEFQIAMPT